MRRRELVALYWCRATMTRWCPPRLCTHSDVIRSNSCFFSEQSLQSTPVPHTHTHTHTHLPWTPSAATACCKKNTFTQCRADHFGSYRPVQRRRSLAAPVRQIRISNASIAANSVWSSSWQPKALRVVHYVNNGAHNITQRTATSAARRNSGVEYQRCIALYSTEKGFVEEKH